MVELYGERLSRRALAERPRDPLEGAVARVDPRLEHARGGVAGRPGDDALDDRGLTAEYVLTRLAARSTRADADEHRQALERIDAEIIRSIGIEHPALTRTAWTMLGRMQHVRDDAADSGGF